MHSSPNTIKSIIFIEFGFMIILHRYMECRSFTPIVILLQIEINFSDSLLVMPGIWCIRMMMMMMKIMRWLLIDIFIQLRSQVQWNSCVEMMGWMVSDAWNDHHLIIVRTKWAKIEFFETNKSFVSSILQYFDSEILFIAIFSVLNSFETNIKKKYV